MIDPQIAMRFSHWLILLALLAAGYAIYLEKKDKKSGEISGDLINETNKRR